MSKREGEKIKKPARKSRRMKELITASAVMLAIGLGSGCEKQNIKYDGRFPKSTKGNVEQTHRFTKQDSKYYQSAFTKFEEMDLEREVSFSVGIKERLGETYEYTLEEGNTISVTYRLEPYFTIISEDNELHELIYFFKGYVREFLGVYSLANKKVLDVSLHADGSLEVWNGFQTIKYDSARNKYVKVLSDKYGLEFMEINQSKGKEFMESIIENEYRKYKQTLRVDDITHIYHEAYENTFNLR